MFLSLASYVFLVFVRYHVVGVILPPSALFSVTTPLPSLVGSLRLFVFIRGVISLFFLADFLKFTFLWCVSFSLLAAGFLLALAPSLSGYGFYFICITALLPLSGPSYVSASLLRCFYFTCCFCLLGGSLLTCFSFTLSLFSCPRFPVNYLLRLPFPQPSRLLPSSLGVRGAVPCASFFLSPFFSSRLLSGWGGCSSFGSLIHGVSFPLAVLFTCLGGRFLWLRIDFLGSCVRLHSLE